VKRRKLGMRKILVEVRVEHSAVCVSDVNPQSYYESYWDDVCVNLIRSSKLVHGL
jgi:hypothetical protein